MKIRLISSLSNYVHAVFLIILLVFIFALVSVSAADEKESAATVADAGIYNAIAFSPSGKYLAAGGKDLLLIKDGSKPPKKIQVKGNINAIAVAENRVIAGTDDSILIIYDINGGEIKRVSLMDGKIKGLAVSSKHIAVLFENKRLPVMLISHNNDKICRRYRTFSLRGLT